MGDRKKLLQKHKTPRDRIVDDISYASQSRAFSCGGWCVILVSAMRLIVQNLWATYMGLNWGYIDSACRPRSID